MIHDLSEGTLTYVLIQLLVIALTAFIAHGKDRSWIGWGVFALFIPLIALTAVICIDRKKAPNTVDPHSSHQENSEWFCEKAFELLKDDKIEESLIYAEKAIQMDPGNQLAADLLDKIKVELNAKVKDSYDQSHSLRL